MHFLTNDYAHHWSHFFTCFSGALSEGLHSLLSIAALWGDGGDVRPAQGSNNVHHGLGLEWVWRNHPWEEVIAPVITQLRGCWRIADLWDLEESKRGRGGERERLLMCWCYSSAASWWLLWWLLWQITFLNGCVWNHSLFTTRCTIYYCHFVWVWNLWTACLQFISHNGM